MSKRPFANSPRRESPVAEEPSQGRLRVLGHQFSTESLSPRTASPPPLQSSGAFVVQARQTAGVLQLVDWSQKTVQERAAAFAQAKKRNDVKRTLLRKWVNEGAAQDDDDRLKNSCEWILAGKANLYALTGTHDWDRDEGRVRYFPYDRFGGLDAAAIFPTTNTNPYYPNPDPPEGVIEFDNSVIARSVRDKGWRQGTEIAIVMHNPSSDASPGRGEVGMTLKHEVQHMADRHSDNLGDETPEDVKAWLNFATEYRAYSLMGDPTYDDLDDSTPGKLDSGPSKVVEMGYTWPSVKSAMIFVQIYSEYPDVKALWDKEAGFYLKLNRKFHKAVLKHNIRSANRDNSVRVDNFYTAFRGLSKDAKANDSTVTAMLGKCCGDSGDATLEKLTAADAGSILDSGYLDYYGKDHDKGMIKRLEESLAAARTG